MNVVDRMNLYSDTMRKKIYEDYIVTLMANQSEDRWAASWYSSIEFLLWEDITEKTVNVLFVEDENREMLLHAATWLNAWPIYGDEGIEFVDINTFGELYNKWKETGEN